MSTIRPALVAVCVIVCVVLQLSVFTQLAVAAVVPDIAMVFVIAAALARGPSYAAGLGFCAGLVLDLAPPADHTLGRWALTFVIVGYLAGLVRQDTNRSVVASAACVAASVFIGTSVFALSGIVLGESGVSIARALQVIPLAVLYDVAVALVLLPVARAVLVGRDSAPAQSRVGVGVR